MSDEYDGEQNLRKYSGCVIQDMRKMDLSDSMMTDRGKWKRKTCCADPKQIGTRAK
jgi:hypothetical protein